ncbi:RNA/RNP complex-1-interacting phosphatase [Bulinus truncatus]|nr:RNA/RNP complex-1-interacting phosphatase [Bulinus truncatus]
MGGNGFSPAILISTLKEKGHSLGGIIDLTFTSKYYNEEEFKKNSIKHWKIFTKGHDVPSENVFQKFAKAVKTVENDGTLIGVHCTHGVNRTGYLICRYMIEEMNMEPDDAISMFNEARGHKLERENYLQDLKLRKKGESTYDPDYKDEECTDTYEYSNFKRKDRWRNNREHHPDWRRHDRRFNRNYPDSSSYADRLQYSTTNTHYNHPSNDIDKPYRNNHSMDYSYRNKNWTTNGSREQETFVYSNAQGWNRNRSYHRNSEEMKNSAEGRTAHEYSNQHRHSRQHTPNDDPFGRVPHSSLQIHKSSEVKPTYDNSIYKSKPEDSSSCGRNSIQSYKRKWEKGASNTDQSVFSEHDGKKRKHSHITSAALDY